MGMDQFGAQKGHAFGWQALQPENWTVRVSRVIPVPMQNQSPHEMRLSNSSDGQPDNLARDTFLCAALP